MLVLGEVVTPWQWAGTAFVVSALVCVVLGGRWAQRRRRPRVIGHRAGGVPHHAERTIAEQRRRIQGEVRSIDHGPEARFRLTARFLALRFVERGLGRVGDHRDLLRGGGAGQSAPGRATAR